MTASISSKRPRSQVESSEGSETDDSFIVPDDSQLESSDDRHKQIGKKTRRELTLLTEQLRKGKLGAKNAESKSSFCWKTDVIRPIDGKKPEESFVVGREQEAMQIIRMIAQPCGGIRPLLLGPIGVGKKSVVRKVASVIVEKSCPEILAGRKIFLVDCVNLLGCRVSEEGRNTLGDYFRHEIEKILEKHNQPILYFRDIDKILDLEHINDYLLSFLKSSVNCIASISGSENDENIQKNIQLLADYNFNVMPILPCSKQETVEIAEHKIAKYPLPKHVVIPHDALKVAVDLADQYVNNRPFPIKAINLIRETANNVWERYVLPQKGGSIKKVQITRESLAKYVQEKTGIPWQELIANSLERIVRLETKLNEQIIGQQLAIGMICKHIKTCKMGIQDERKPWGSFFLSGPTGVGKSELAKCLSRELFHDENALIQIDMSEYSESHSVSRLIGAPPGYLGYDSGGLLTNFLKKRPHSIVLLDEFEKAHEQVQLVFLQVMNDGRLTDGKGNTIDCRNSLFLMTSNLGSQEIIEFFQKKNGQDEKALRDLLKVILTSHLRPEFCNRLTEMIPFAGLRVQDIPKLIDVHLKRLAQRLDKKGIQLHWDDAVIKFFASQPYDPNYGMRAVCRGVEFQLNKTLTDSATIMKEYLRGKVKLLIQDGVLSVAQMTK